MNFPGINFVKLISYEEVFEKDSDQPIEKYLSDMPIKCVLCYISYISIHLHLNETDHNKQKDIFYNWIAKFPENKKSISKTISFKLGFEIERDTFLFNNYSILLLIQEALQIYDNNEEFVEDLTPKQYYELFICLLIANAKYNEIQNMASYKLTNDSIDDLLKNIITVFTPFYEFWLSKDISIQFTKAVHFFRFCEKNHKFKEILKNFLDIRCLNTWQEYLGFISRIYIEFLFNNRKPLLKLKQLEKVQHFLESLSIKEFEYYPSIDFKTLRETPILKFNDNQFLFLYVNFFIDKLYQGIMFDMKETLKISKFQNKSFNEKFNLKSEYSYLFSEKTLFYAILEYIFIKHKGYIQKNGEELNEFFINGEPDYYVRNGKHILIFEFKDVILSSKVKNSYNYDEIINGLKLKFYKNQRGESKAIKQLCSTIEKILRSDFHSYDNIKKKSLNIYPILIYTDYSFKLNGFNYILNNIYKEELFNYNFEKKHKIKDLIIIHLDTLIKYQDLFHNKQINLIDLINIYQAQTKSSIDPFVKIKPFDFFLADYCKGINIKLSKFLETELPEISYNIL